MPGAPLELHEREEIFRALVEGPQASWAAIGRRVGRHPTTVAREVGRGGGRGCYGPATAQRRDDRARGASRRRGRCGTASPPSCAWGRSPEAIRADLAAEDVEAPPCVETVYQALYSGALDVKPLSVCAAGAGGDAAVSSGNPGRRPAGRTSPPARRR